MKTLYGFGDVVPPGTSTPTPSSTSRAALASAVSMSQPESNTENIRALSVEYIFSTPTASTTSAVPARSCVTARWNAVEAVAHAFSTL